VGRRRFVSNTSMHTPDPTEQRLHGVETSTSGAVLQVDGLSFHHPGRKLFERWSASILPGVTLVRGGDGRGKTTLLRLLAGQLPAAAGQLQIRGLRLQDQAQAYRNQLFWVEPRSEAFDHMTAVEYFESQRGRYPGFDAALLARLVQGLGLQEQINKPLYMLSTGSKRKVWLAAAFASGAALTLLDLPFAALDKASIAFVLALLQQAAQHPERAWVLADYEAPAGLRLAGLMDLGD
jgi:ABC-type transport system involved in cytochrome c biogenesis ATPase subunit